MDFEKYITTLKLKVSNNSDAVLGQLLEEIRVTSEKFNQIILLRSKWNEVQRISNIGIATFEVIDIQRNKIINSILMTLDQLIENDLKKEIRNSFKELNIVEDINILDQSFLETDAFQKVVPYMKMTNWEEIYQRAIRLVAKAEYRVLATAFGAGLWKGKAEYLETLAQNIARQKKENNQIIHRLVFGDRGKEFRDSNVNNRVEIFKKHGVEENLIIKELDEDWGIDFLIVDHKHLHLSFQSLSNRSLFIGIEIINSPEIVAPISRWYDEFIFEKANRVYPTRTQEVVTKNYLFGYGSLVNRRSIKLPIKSDFIPVRVFGIKRGWYLNIDEDYDTGLGAIIDTRSYCNGVLIEITDGSLEEFDQREIMHGYKRIELNPKAVEFLDSSHFFETGTKLWGYVTEKPELATEKFPIAQSYLDVVLDGFLDVGEDFAIEFINSTDGWNLPWINDRMKPRYRRFFKVDQELVDQLLEKSLPNEIFNRVKKD